MPTWMEWLSLLAPAWLIGSVLVGLTAPLGCLMLWRKMAFFADTLAHGTLLGVALAALLSLPYAVGVAVVATLLVGLLLLLHDRRLPTDALLALCSSTLLCLGLVLINQIPAERAALMGYLFGDLLGLAWGDAPLLIGLSMLGMVVLWRVWSAQIQVAFDADIAASEGVNVFVQRLIFMGVLALFTVLALKAVGSLLMGALLVIPALTARLLAHSPKHMVLWAFVVAHLGMTGGVWGSVWWDIATGWAIVLVLSACFISVFVWQRLMSKKTVAA